MRKCLQLASPIERILDRTSSRRLLQHVLHSSFPYFLETPSKGQLQTFVTVRNKQKRMLNSSVITFIAETLLGNDWARLFQVIWHCCPCLAIFIPSGDREANGVHLIHSREDLGHIHCSYVDTLQVSCIQRYSWSHQLLGFVGCSVIDLNIFSAKKYHIMIIRCILNRWLTSYRNSATISTP